MAASAQTEGWHQPTYLLGKGAHIPIFLRFFPLTVEQMTDTSLYSVAEFHAHRTKCLLSHSFLPFSFHLFSLSRYCFHFSVCQGFPLHVFDFSIPSPPPQGSLLLQLTDICQWRNITTIADVEMLIPSPLSPRLPPLRGCGTSPLVHSAAGSCFCPLKRAGVDCTTVGSVRPLRWTANHCP